MKLRNLPFIVLATLPLLAGCSDSRYKIDIQREYSTPEEAALIDVAEHVCPTSEDVLHLYSVEKGADLEGKSTYSSMSDLLDSWSQQINEARRTYPLLTRILFPLASASLYYRADIEFQEQFINETDQFDNVYVVHMIISYGQTIGPLTGSGFRKERTVILTADSEVRAVYNAGCRWIS